MQTNRFETFLDAIIAIIITILILKISQPAAPTLSAVLDKKVSYLAYFISFLIIFNVWYNNHNLFQKVDEIDNRVVWIYGAMTFVVSLIPYFTMWVAINVYSVPCETMFGVAFILTNVLNIIAIKSVHRSNPYNDELEQYDYDFKLQLVPALIVLIGLVLTYTVYVPATYFSCLIAVVMWILIEWRPMHGN